MYSQYLCESVIENIGKLVKVTQNELVNEVKVFNPNHVFIASKPWCPVFTDKILEFKLGHRVANLNPDLTHYIPFGAEGTIIALLDSQYAEVLWDDFLIKSMRLVVPIACLLNLTIPIIIIKRGNIERMPIFRSKAFNDSSFKPEIFNKKISETPEDIITKAMKDITVNEVKLNPDAKEFSFAKDFLDGPPAPTGIEFPLPSFK